MERDLALDVLLDPATPGVRTGGSAVRSPVLVGPLARFSS
jgi:hypothetical protein